jgi:hypothetical protein
MRPRHAVLASSAVALAGASVLFATTVVGCGADVDRRSYVAKNLALLDTVPTFPGARLIAVSSSPYRASDMPGARIAGYGTVRDYRLPAGTRPRTVISYYRRTLESQWKPVAGAPARYVSLRRGDAYLHVLAGRGDVVLEIDHDCSLGCFGP